MSSALKSREGLKFEKDFTAASNRLLAHLRDKPECRELLPELGMEPARPSTVEHLEGAPDSPDGDGAPSSQGRGDAFE